VAGITFINQLNIASHGLTALWVKTRLKGDDQVEEADLLEGKSASLSFTLPVATYLERRTLQYALMKAATAGPAGETPWRDWDMDKSGVIGVTADLF
jgi:hypothetical protein